ncbi:MAG: hypothetical protein VYD39_04000, partial [Bacteroidota bacterium]|nr:hypothetical protein [Bacteroidota bacterium]
MKKSMFLFNGLIALFSTSCSTLQFTGTAFEELKTPSTEVVDWENVNQWQHADISTENFPGLSVHKTYDELLQDKQGK